MSTLDSTAVAVLDDQQGLAELPDFTTDAYKDAYSRINAIVIEGEQEAHDNVQVFCTGCEALHVLHFHLRQLGEFLGLIWNQRA